MHFKCAAIVFLVVVSLLVPSIAETHSDDASIESNCTTSYKALVAELLENDENFYKLQMTFFPPNSNSPVFVTVVYQYDNGTYSNSSNIKTFFWSSAIYFFFHPVRISQFTSLLFSDPSLRYDEVVLNLPANCFGASADYMTLLTQRVS